MWKKDINHAKYSKDMILQSPSQKKMVRPGLSLDGRFVLVDEISHGSYGIVWCATDLKTKQSVAIKFVPAFNDYYERDFTFKSEIESLKALSGVEGIPQLYGIGMFGFNNFMATDIFDQDIDDLRSTVPGQVFKLTTILQVIWNTVNILRSVHNLGIVHRDIKLGNLMIKKRNQKNELYLIDFGLAARFRHPNTGRREPVSNCDLAFERSAYSPPRVAKGEEYLETEDLIALSYAAVFMTVNKAKSVPWYSDDIGVMQRKKIQFGKHPEMFLNKYRCLAPAIGMINAQKYGDIPDYESILKFVKYTLDELNAPTDVKF